MIKAGGILKLLPLLSSTSLAILFMAVLKRFIRHPYLRKTLINMANDGPVPDRSQFSSRDTVSHIWAQLGLPPDALSSLSLPDSSPGPELPSSFKLKHIAQSSIALSALSAALVRSVRNKTAVPKVTVPSLHSCIEFKSEKLHSIDGKPSNTEIGVVGGLHKTADGYVRIHDNFPHHRYGMLSLLGLPLTASRSDVASATLNWKSVDLETAAFKSGVVISALRSYEQWDSIPQSLRISSSPIQIFKIGEGSPGLPLWLTAGSDRSLRGLRVLELSRVIAAPVAGRTLAAHGANVLWITSPNLPDLPDIDRDFARGKRTAQLDLTSADGQDRLKALARDADVFIQGYRPGSLASRGFSASDLSAINPGIIYANMSAYGPSGPWSGNRGYDSLVQTCSGMNISEAEHFGAGEPARPTPCQALDHAAGYFLAAGICAALYKRAVEGGSYEVHVSLAGTMKYLRSLGQYPGREGFNCSGLDGDEVREYLETRPSGFGSLTAVRHSAAIEGAMPGWDIMPMPLGSDSPEWTRAQA
jgi:hypothetical protein